MIFRLLLPAMSPLEVHTLTFAADMRAQSLQSFGPNQLPSVHFKRLAHATFVEFSSSTRVWLANSRVCGAAEMVVGGLRRAPGATTGGPPWRNLKGILSVLQVVLVSDHCTVFRPSCTPPNENPQLQNRGGPERRRASTGISGNLSFVFHLFSVLVSPELE